jgi:hypothetical protein
VANLPFNVGRIDKNRLDYDPRFLFDLAKATQVHVDSAVLQRAQQEWVGGFNKDGRARLCAELNIQPNM